jgi:uncharacterized protein with HEPN domain
MADLDRLEHLLELIDDVQRYASAQTGRAPYDASELVRTWARHKLPLMGEAVTQLSGEIQSRHAEIPWRLIRDMRNRLVHGYDQIDDDLVWNTVVDDLPPLRQQIQATLEQERRRRH